jgi:uncharacterized membrane protein
MDTETFGSHYEEHATVNAPADLLFDYLDDFEQLGAHMTRSSWMVAGAKMRYEFDDGKGRRVGSRVRLLGSFLGLKLEIEERVTNREPARSKAWQTVENPRMLILARYRMGFSLQPLLEGCRLTAFIGYALPGKGIARLLGALAGGIYARWCVRNVLQQALVRFGSAAEGVAPAADT